DVGRRVHPAGHDEAAEIDVLSWKPRCELLAIECKGQSPTSEVSEADIDDWLTRQVPRVYDYFQTQDDLRVSRPSFEYWTTGVFAPRAIDMLEARSANVRKYRIGWKDGASVYEYVKRIKSRRLKDVYSEHYINHPLADL